MRVRSIVPIAAALIVAVTAFGGVRAQEAASSITWQEAVVYPSDISINYDPLDGSLKGDNRGLLAFDVVAVVQEPDTEDSVLPDLEVEIVNALDVFDDDGNLVEAGVCAGDLTLLDDDLEVPSSSSDPSP